MATPASIRRDHAARLLGVPADADDATVRRAFRAWASLVHPDHGGDARSFADLCRARDILLRADDPTVGEAAGEARAHAEPAAPRPRRAWRDVVVWPGAPLAGLLALGGVLAALSVIAGLWVDMPWGIAPAALFGAAWCCVVTSAVVRGGDAGHVIVVRSAAWSVVACGQVAVAALLGIAIIGVLPVLALPFVAVIAAVNPGAGLWRAARRN